jgi:hypothetical protein
MSSAKEGRKSRPISGTSFLAIDRERLGSGRVAEVIGAALQLEFGETHAAVKILVGLTGANKRAAKNWLEARNSPNCESLISLCRHSERVFETVLLLAGREQVLKAKKLADAKGKLERCLKYWKTWSPNAIGPR